MLAKFATDPGLLVSTKGRNRINIIVTIDPHGTCPEGTSNLMSAAHVASPDSSGKTIGRIIALEDRIILVLEGDYRSDRTKDFFPCDSHVVLHAGKDRWIDEVGL